MFHKTIRTDHRTLDQAQINPHNHLGLLKTFPWLVKYKQFFSSLNLRNILHQFCHYNTEKWFFKRSSSYSSRSTNKDRNGNRRYERRAKLRFSSFKVPPKEHTHAFDPKKSNMVTCICKYACNNLQLAGTIYTSQDLIIDNDTSYPNYQNPFAQKWDQHAEEFASQTNQRYSSICEGLLLMNACSYQTKDIR